MATRISLSLDNKTANKIKKVAEDNGIKMSVVYRMLLELIHEVPEEQIAAAWKNPFKDCLKRTV